MIKHAVLFGLLLLALVSQGQYKGYTYLPDPGAFKKSFANASQKISSIKCNFIQEKSLNMLDEKLVSKGKFWFKKENRVRMEYEQPFQYLMVINNSQVFVRDGNKENKISTRSNKMFGQINRIMVDCVQGTALNNPDFSVRVFEGTQNDLVELSPISKSMKEMFKTIVIQVEKSDYSASRIALNEINGDNTTIRFINKELNVEIPDSLFSAY